MLKILQGIPGPSKAEVISERTRSGDWPMYAMICSESQYSSEGEDKALIEIPKLSNMEPAGLCFRRTVKLILNGAPFVIVDNCNYTVAEVAPYVRLAEAFSYDYEIVFCDPGDITGFEQELNQLRNFSQHCPENWKRTTILKGR
jgi:hypothetical protein